MGQLAIRNEGAAMAGIAISLFLAALFLPIPDMLALVIYSAVSIYAFAVVMKLLPITGKGFLIGEGKEIERQGDNKWQK